MSVLVEFLNVVVRTRTLEEKYPGGLAWHRRHCPNGTYCADAHLTRVGFMTPHDVEGYVTALEQLGLTFVRDGRCVDIAVVAERQGTTTPCDWLALAPADGHDVCWLAGTAPGDLAVPDGWVPAAPGENLTLSPEEFAARMRFLRSDGEVEVFLDRLTGKEHYVGTPFLRQSMLLTDN